MNPPSLRALFDAVAELPATAQRAALENLTADAALIEKVLRLCAQDRVTDHKIVATITGNVTQLTSNLTEELTLGQTLDTWRLVDKIGEGGMGTVFLAERADGHFRQSVAVKVMHGLATETAAARLAQATHENTETSIVFMKFSRVVFSTKDPRSSFLSENPIE